MLGIQQFKYLQANISKIKKYLEYKIYRETYNECRKDWTLSKPIDVTVFTKKTIVIEKDHNAEFKQKLKQTGMLEEVERMIEAEKC